jgi:hypothetical protein
MRSVQDMLGLAAAMEHDRALGNPGPALVPAGLGAQPAGTFGQPNTEALGALTGAPPRTTTRVIQIAPATVSPTMVVPPTRESRVIILIAPFVGFGIFIGDTGVKISDMQLPPGLPYDVVLPGFQELYAVTDAPVFLPLRIQIAAILIGDRERKL